MKELDGIKYYSLKEVSEWLGLTNTSVYRMFKRKKISGVKIGNEIYVEEKNRKLFLEII